MRLFELFNPSHSLIENKIMDQNTVQREVWASTQTERDIYLVGGRRGPQRFIQMRRRKDGLFEMKQRMCMLVRRLNFSLVYDKKRQLVYATGGKYEEKRN